MKTFSNNNIQCHGTSQIKFEVAMIILHMHALFMNNVINTVEYRPQTVVVSQGLVGTSLVPMLSTVLLMEAASTTYTAESLDTRLEGVINSILFEVQKSFPLGYICACLNISTVCIYACFNY